MGDTKEFAQKFWEYKNREYLCTIYMYAGVVSSYAVLPLAIWIAVQIGYILAAILAPFHFNQMKQKKWKIHILHFVSLMIGILSPLVPSIATLASGGFTSEDTKFPPIVCFARNRDITVYFLLIPLAVLMSTIITQLILIIQLLIRCGSQ